MAVPSPEKLTMVAGGQEPLIQWSASETAPLMDGAARQHRTVLADNADAEPPAARANSFCPPYSVQSRWALALLVLLTCGVKCASELPPAPPPPWEVTALRAWKALALVWSPILMWLVLIDPGAQALGATSGGGSDEAPPQVVHCQHGCAVASLPRTKHCKRCHKCVAGYDHHCLWLNTCVGSRNYRPWAAFVALLFVWNALGCGISWNALIRALPVRSRQLAVGHRPAALLTGLGTGCTATWLLLLLALHLYLFYRGLTTIEWITSGSELIFANEVVQSGCVKRFVLFGRLEARDGKPNGGHGVPLEHCPAVQQRAARPFVRRKWSLGASPTSDNSGRGVPHGLSTTGRRKIFVKRLSLSALDTLDEHFDTTVELGDSIAKRRLSLPPHLDREEFMGRPIRSPTL